MVFFGRLTGPYPADAAIWWCLRTGGGGVVTSVALLFVVPERICVTKLFLVVQLG
jgi:hypothetical protein